MPGYFEKIREEATGSRELDSDFGPDVDGIVAGHARIHTASDAK